MTPLDLIEERLSRRGCHPKRRGDTLTARCPAHDDHSPSLSVTTGERRDIALHCHAGCDPAEVMAALELSWTDLSEKRQDSTIVGTYPYHDADGTLLYEVVRLSPKSFRQRRPDGRGGWVWNLRGVDRVPYRLPELLAAVAVAEEVWITEGEKDADALAGAGVTATCNSGGAGKWEMSHAQWLRGASGAVIVADDDEPGRDHARTVAGTLSLLGIPWRTVTAATGKDAADHLAAGHGIGDFVAAELDAADASEVLEPEVDRFPLERFLVDWATFWDEDDTEDDWLMEPLFAAGRGHALYAGAKTGKSWVLLAACLALATGRRFLAHPGGEPVDVLYVDYEMTRDDLRDRCAEFGYGAADDLSHFHYALLPSIDALDTHEGGQALLESALAVDARFVVIDTTSRAVAGEENDADTFRAFYRHTGLPLKQAGIGYVRADHAGKDAERGQRGSSAKNDDVDVVIKLTNLDGGKMWTATHRRMSWYPERTTLTVTEANGAVTFTGDGPSWPAGTAEVAEALESLGVPLDASGNAATAALKEAGNGARRTVALAAQKYRRSIAEPVELEGLVACGQPCGEPSEVVPGTTPRNGGVVPVGTSPEPPSEIVVPEVGNHREPPEPPHREGLPVTVREPVDPGATPGQDEQGF